MIEESTILEKQVTYICIIYAALTVLCLAVLQHFSWAPIQIRISEALCVVALFSYKAAPKLAIGCAAANLCGMLIFNLYPLGLLDVICGSLATLLGAFWCYKFRNNIPKALFGFVLANALIVAAYLPLIAQGSDFYTIPFTNISLDGNYLGMYLFGVISIGISEAISVYAIGWPISKFIGKPFFAHKQS